MLHLALDPNVCIAADHDHPFSSRLLDTIWEGREYLRLVVDAQGVLRSEYEQLIGSLSETQRTWLRWVLDNGHKLLETVDISDLENRLQILSQEGCGTPVEPQLLSLCWERGRSIKALVVGPDFQHSDLRARGVHDTTTVARLRHDLGVDFVVWSSIDASRFIAEHLQTDPPWPSNEMELDALLAENNSEENDQLEFKQPNNEHRERGYHLTRSILLEVMEAICGLANANGGKVLLGIGENRAHSGEKIGFELAYEKRGSIKPSCLEDLFNTLATDELLLQNFYPRIVPTGLRYNEIRLDNGRYVLVFHVKKMDSECYYGGNLWCRFGRQNRRISVRE